MLPNSRVIPKPLRGLFSLATLVQVTSGIKVRKKLNIFYNWLVDFLNAETLVEEWGGGGSLERAVILGMILIRDKMDQISQQTEILHRESYRH